MSTFAAWLKGHPQVRQLMLPVIWLRRHLIIRRAQAKQAALRSKLFGRIIDGYVTFDLPEFSGRFDIGIRSDISSRIIFEGGYESVLAGLCVATLDSTRDAIDVGANVGLYTVLLAKHISSSKRILSLEPAPTAFRLLVRNVSQNAVMDRVICKQVAASPKDAQLSLYAPRGREEYSSISDTLPTSQGDSFECYRVIGLSLDRLCEEHGIKPGFIKIDVEGYEYQALLGASGILSKFRPTVLIEIAPSLLAAHGDSAAKILTLLSNLGYCVVDAESTSTTIGKTFGGYALALPRTIKPVT